MFPPHPHFAFFPLIGCTDLAHEMKRFSLPMLPQSDSHPQQKGGTRHDQWCFLCTSIFLFLYSGSAASLSGVKEWATKDFCSRYIGNAFYISQVSNFENLKELCILRESWANFDLVECSFVLLLVHDGSSSISLGNKHPILWCLWI